MSTKPRSRPDPSGRPCGCAQLDRHILGYRQYLADRGNAAGYARSCEAAVWAHGAPTSRGVEVSQIAPTGGDWRS